MVGRRRILLWGGVSVLGAGAVVYGGSLATCALRGDTQAMLRPLFVAVSRISAPARVGAAWLQEESPNLVVDRLLDDDSVFAAILLPGAEDRMRRISDLIRDDFRDGRFVLADRWVVSQTEARIAAAWVSQKA